VLRWWSRRISGTAAAYRFVGPNRR
jgi:hypothetical protein